MFGNLGDIAGMFKQLGQMQQNMAKMQEELSKMHFEADAGAGLVRAIVNGKMELIDIRIDPQAATDVDMLEDLVKAAITAATRKAQQGAKEQLGKLTGGINIPGLENLLGGGR